MSAKKIKIVIGKRYGSLVLVEETSRKAMKRKDGSTEMLRRVLCKCDCGKGFIADLGRLNRGGITSCGCKHKPVKKKIIPVAIGKINMLRVIEEVKRVRGRRMVKYKCDCGKVKTGIWNNIKYGKTKSCGCLRGRPKLKKNENR